MFLRRDGRLVRIDKPDSAKASVHRDLLLLELREDWTVAGKTYPAGALLATDFDAFLDGARRFDVLFAPGARKSLAAFSPTRNAILVNELDNVRNRVYVADPQGRQMDARRVAGAEPVRHGERQRGRRRRVGRLLHDRHRLPHADAALPRHAREPRRRRC